MIRSPLLLAVCFAAALSGCSSSEDGPLDLAFIAAEDELFATGLRLSEGAQHVRAATDLGLVARDAQGEIIPGLADRWIVTDDGRSFIFRLREGTWPDGSPLTAESARAALVSAIRGLEGTSMERDLHSIDEVRAMAGRVVELRLSGPFPALLQLLAQPELALEPGAGTGPMVMNREVPVAVLSLKPPEQRGLPAKEDWREGVRPVRIIALPAQAALAQFEEGEVDAVLGGRIDSLPLVDTGPLSRGTIRVDPAIGLFGLIVQRDSGALESEEMREAIAMAIDRPALIAPFGIGGWTPTTRVVAPGLPDDPGYITERWTDRSLDELRAEARRRVTAWRAGQDDVEQDVPLVLTLEIGEGSGLDVLFRELAAQLAQIDIRLERAGDGERGDLALIDRIARFAAPRWFLNQFHCSLQRGACNEKVDFLVDLAVDEDVLAARAAFLAQAESELIESNIYIPFGAPLRWSLVRGDVAGFVPNRWAFHPLPQMAQIAR